MSTFAAVLVFAALGAAVAGATTVAVALLIWALAFYLIELIGDEQP